MNSTPWCVTFSADDTLNDRLKKAAHVKPSPAQIKWMEREYTAFLHYSPNTYTGRQWGTGQEDPAEFAPTEQDPRQWVKVCADAGMKMIVPTVKHHDGFCQWNTQSTDFSVKNASVKDDIVQKLSDACREMNIDLGVYLSPWDMNQKHKGVWNTPEYQKVYMTQLRELMEQYGEMGELWLDGACGDYRVWHLIETYNPTEWYDYVEEKQPDCVIRMYDPFEFAAEAEWAQIRSHKAELRWRGKGVRWVGNESGTSRANEWSVQPVFSRTFGREATYRDLGEEHYYNDAVGAVWYPVEVNTVLLNQWFWNEGTSHVRSLDDLIKVFYHSMGNNGTLLLNVSPDNRGLIPDDQIARLNEFKQFIDGTFSCDLASGGKAAADSEDASHKASAVLEQDIHTYWMPDIKDWDIDASTATIEIDLGEMKTFDNISLREYIYEGQRVNLWTVKALIDGEWTELVQKKTIGYRTIRKFDVTTTNKIQLCILRSWDVPMISRISLHLSHIPQSNDNAKQDEALSFAPVSINADNLQSGLAYEYFNGGVQSAKAIGNDNTQAPAKTGNTSIFTLDTAEKTIDYSVLMKGYIYIPEDSTVSFKLGSADGCVLYINDQPLADNDEPHEYREIVRDAEMKCGYYKITLKYTSFRNPGALSVMWKIGTDDFKSIDAGSLYK